MRTITRLLITGALLILSGCSKQMKDDSGERRQTSHFSIEVVKAVSEPALKDDQLVAVQFKIKNIGDVDFAIGGSDFYLKDAKGNEHQITSNQPNFGDELKKGDSLEGHSYYQLPEKERNVTVIYRPFKTVESEWYLKLPKK